MGEEEDRQKKSRLGGGEGERNACYKGPYWFISAVAGGRKIPIRYSDNRTGFFTGCSIAKTIKMAAQIDVLARTLADLNVVSRSEFKLKPEQEVAVKSSIRWKRCISGVAHRIRQKPHISNVCSSQRNKFGSSLLTKNSSTLPTRTINNFYRRHLKFSNCVFQTLYF